MIRDLVLYFLKQGKYSGPGDIAVLCAYLGQLQKVRAALKDMKIAVSVDTRDEDELLKQGLGDEASFEEVNIAKHVCFLYLCWLYGLNPLKSSKDSSWHSRYISGSGSENCYCFSCKKYRRFQQWLSFNRVS